VDWRANKLEIGEATYEYCGICIDCGKRLYNCTSIKCADDALEGRVATFYGNGELRCQEHREEFRKTHGY